MVHFSIERWYTFQLKYTIAEYSKVIEINPRNADAYFSRGLAKIVNGDVHGGCLDLSKAKELGYVKAHEMIQKYCN